jgi:hypothetical protein
MGQTFLSSQECKQGHRQSVLSLLLHHRVRMYNLCRFNLDKLSQLLYFNSRRNSLDR